MKLSKILRTYEWWEFKVPPVLSMAYASILFCSLSVAGSAGYIVFVILALSVLGAYASFINDLTDIEADIKCGKSNYMAGLHPAVRWVLPLAALAAGAACSTYIYPDTRSLLFYSLIVVSISLYSFKPARLKERGLWGVLSCGAAEHLFPSLFCASFIAGQTEPAANMLWAIFPMTLLYGIRGILWHQFQDRANDIQAGINTFAARVNPAGFVAAERWLLLAECVSLAAFLYVLADPVPVIFMAAYFILVAFRYRVYGNKPIIILAPENRHYQVLLNDYYQVFLPVSLLISMAIADPYAWFVLIAHILLFPGKILLTVKDFFLFGRILFAALKKA